MAMGPKANGKNPAASAAATRGRISITAAFLSCAAIAYVLVLGTQFRMMAILGDHHERMSIAAADDPAATGGGRGATSRRDDGDHHHSLEKVKRKWSGRGGYLHRRERTASNDGGGKKASQSKGDRRPERSNNDAHVAAASASASASSAERSQLYETMASSIAQKWNLTTPDAVDLLVQQFNKENDYDPENDFFHFHHLYKSGGTSISNLLDQTVGLPSLKNGYFEGILPGSYESGNFDHDEALKDIEKRLAAGTDREDLPYRASYAHTGLRPAYGPRRTKTAKFLLEHLPKRRRLRAITMLRDPTDFRASNHAMIMCGLNYEVSRFNRERVAKGLEATCVPKEGLNISALVDRKMSDLLEKCHKADELEARGIKPEKPPAQLRKQCKTQEEEGIDTLVHCRSPRHLLDSQQYDKHFRSMFTCLMGRMHRGQEFDNSTAYGRMGYGFDRAEDYDGYSVENVEEYTLQDLGGLDLTISGAGDGVGPPEPDFIWFGITERMKESTALFYYYFKAKPLRKTPIHRVQDCRPTSWWTAEDREAIKEREPADYAVWRAANAILDVRVEKMKMEIRSLLDAGEMRESLFYVDWDQLEEIGIEF